jgi:hypothetical protein
VDSKAELDKRAKLICERRRHKTTNGIGDAIDRVRALSKTKHAAKNQWLPAISSQQLKCVSATEEPQVCRIVDASRPTRPSAANESRMRAPMADIRQTDDYPPRRTKEAAGHVEGTPGIDEMLQHVGKDDAVELAARRPQMLEALGCVTAEHSVEVVTGSLSGNFVDLNTLDAKVRTARLKQCAHCTAAAADIEDTLNPIRDQSSHTRTTSVVPDMSATNLSHWSL